MRGFDRRFWVALFATFWISLASCAAQSAGAPEEANPRIALVIGAASYPDAKLATPVNDASLMTGALKSAGFDVIGAANPDLSRMHELLHDFLEKARAAGPDMQAFVYFSGRAIQYEGDNYLIPVDAKIARGSEIPLEAVNLADFRRALADTPGLARIIVVDGARANTYAKEGRPLAGGLAMEAPGAGSLISFNAAPGAIGPEQNGPYGVYTKTLAEQMRQGGVPIEEVFRRTRLAVNEATGGAVAPWSVSKLSEPYYLLTRDESAPPASNLPAETTPMRALSPGQAYDLAVLKDTLQGYQEFLAAFPNSPEAERVRAMAAARREALIWRQTRDLNTPQAYWTYLTLFPKGAHAGDAERALEALGASTTPPKDFQRVDYGEAAGPATTEIGVIQEPYYYFGPTYGPPPPEAYNLALPEENFDWQNLPAPAPIFGDTLPVLPFVVPLPPHTHHHDHHHHEGEGAGGSAGQKPPTSTGVAAPPSRPIAGEHDHAPPGALGTAPTRPGQFTRGRAFEPAGRQPLTTPAPPATFPHGLAGAAPHWHAPGRLAPRSFTAPLQPTITHFGPLATPIRPQLYLAPRLAQPAPMIRPLTPVFRAAPSIGIAAPHFAAPATPHFAAPPPAIAAPAIRH